jgi:hypothetical protein
MGLSKNLELKARFVFYIEALLGMFLKALRL